MAQSKIERSATMPQDALEDLNKEKQTLVSELSALAGEVGTKASCLQFIPKDIKVNCRIELDIKKAPVFLLILIIKRKK